MKKIKLTKGKYALVDDADYEWLNQWKWHCADGYAKRAIKKDGKWRSLAMAREILGAKDGEVCDHINRNPLNNMRKNLRIVTYSQNNMNRGCRGYYLHKRTGLFQVKISRKSFGYFKTERMARKAYLTAYKEYFVIR
jgi:hypothetical protein